jgi:hypothetical protein
MNTDNTQSTSIIEGILGKLFAPLDEYLMRKGITGFVIPFVGLTIVVYFQIFHKREKGKKYSGTDVLMIVGWFIMLFLTVMSQFDMIYPPKSDLEYYRDRIADIDAKKKH